MHRFCNIIIWAMNLYYTPISKPLQFEFTMLVFRCTTMTPPQFYLINLQDSMPW